MILIIIISLYLNSVKKNINTISTKRFKNKAQQFSWHCLHRIFVYKQLLKYVV